MSGAQRLPMEIIFHIIDSIIDEPRRTYDPSHPITKTLLSFTLVCRATHAHASNRLRQQCMFIDDQERLRKCLAYLDATRHLVPEYNTTQTAVPQLGPPVRRLCPITRLYLALPLPEMEVQDVQQSMYQIGELCTLIRPKLRQLVLDFSLCRVVGTNRAGNMKVNVQRYRLPLASLMSGLLPLPELQEFVNLSESQEWLALPTLSASMLRRRHTGAPKGRIVLWDQWPNLRRLALFGNNDKEQFWGDARKATRLETFISMTGFGMPRLQTCLKSAYLHAAPNQTSTEAEEYPPTPLKVVIAASREDLDRDEYGKFSLPGSHNWTSVDPTNIIDVNIKVLPFSTPVPLPFKVLEDREYMRTAALRGELWDWEGEIVS